MNTLVQITYGVRKHPDHDGWLPVVTERIDEGKPHVSAPWGRPLDEDHALFLAKDHAEHRASRYLGDYTVVVSEASRRNPRRPPPPPPSHTFALEAHPYQQGLFAPSSYEAKQKKRAPEPIVDERQVDLFAPLPAKKNPCRPGAPRRRR
jgi:hypothetical protein